jgi:hypothetical protein
VVFPKISLHDTVSTLALIDEKGDAPRLYAMIERVSPTDGQSLIPTAAASDAVFSAMVQDTMALGQTSRA